MAQPVIKPLTAADLKAARASWEKVCAEPDPNSQMIGVLLWCSVWVEPLMRAAAISVIMTDKQERH